MEELTNLVCQDCGAAYQVKASTLTFFAGRDSFEYKRLSSWCKPCRQARIQAMLSGSALRQVIEALASTNA